MRGSSGSCNLSLVVRGNRLLDPMLRHAAATLEQRKEKNPDHYGDEEEQEDEHNPRFILRNWWRLEFRSVSCSPPEEDDMELDEPFLGDKRTWQQQASWRDDTVAFNLQEINDRLKRRRTLATETGTYFGNMNPDAEQSQ
jgi:hypothetical protein